MTERMSKIQNKIGKIAMVVMGEVPSRVPQGSRFSSVIVSGGVFGCFGYLRLSGGAKTILGGFVRERSAITGRFRQILQHLDHLFQFIEKVPSRKSVTIVKMISQGGHCFG